MASSSVLLVVTDVSAGWLDRARRQVSNQNVHVLLPAAPDDEVTELPGGWKLLSHSELVDNERLREGVLRFLEEWPSLPVTDDRSFDDLFRQSDGYSVWWTGPGIERNVDGGLFLQLQTLWAFDHAIKTLAPESVFVYTKSPGLAAALVSRCERDRLPCDLLDGSSHPSNPWAGRVTWLLYSLRQLSLYPAKISIRALAARLLARTNPVVAARREHPAIVFTSQFSRCVRVGDEGVSVWFWQALCDRIVALKPDLRCCHVFRLGREIPGYRAISSFYHAAWPLLRRIDGAAPPRERHAALRWWWRSVPSQLAALWRYFRVEAQPRFRASFSFAGADVSSMYVPTVRDAIAGISEWAQTVGAIQRSLQAVGNVRAMLVFEEMYRPGMLNIAAARALGIPTIGVQHGMIMPEHVIYTLPRGQVQGAPVPDYFAAMSVYAKEVMSRHGSYPADRIWITGSPRFDDLISNPPDRRQARVRLGLSPESEVVLVTTQTAAWFPAAVRAVFEAARSRSQCIVCVKVHPKTRGLSSDAYRTLAQQVGASNVLCFDDRFDDLLAACDVLISASSTTILEATLLGRRTICVNFSGAPDRYPYVEDGASVAARSPQELAHALQTVLAPGSGAQLEARRQWFLRRHAGPAARGDAAMTLARNVLGVAFPESAGDEQARVSAMPVSEHISAGFSA